MIITRINVGYIRPLIGHRGGSIADQENRLTGGRISEQQGVRNLTTDGRK